MVLHLVAVSMEGDVVAESVLCATEREKQELQRYGQQSERDKRACEHEPTHACGTRVDFELDLSTTREDILV
jgi:hypothetical protein